MCESLGEVGGNPRALELRVSRDRTCATSRTTERYLGGDVVAMGCWLTVVTPSVTEHSPTRIQAPRMMGRQENSCIEREVRAWRGKITYPSFGVKFAVQCSSPKHLDH